MTQLTIIHIAPNDNPYVAEIQELMALVFEEERDDYIPLFYWVLLFRADELIGAVSYDHRDGRVWIGNLTIHPFYRRRGYSQLLAEQVFAYTDAELYGEVAADNYVARRLYEGLGCELVGISGDRCQRIAHYVLTRD